MPETRKISAEDQKLIDTIQKKHGKSIEELRQEEGKEDNGMRSN